MKTVDLQPQAFIDAGGQVSLAEWVELDQAEQDALAEAGRERDRRMARATAAAVQDLFSEMVSEMQLLALADAASGGPK